MSGWLPEGVVTQRVRLRQHELQGREDLVGLFTDEHVRRYVGCPMTEAEARSRVLDTAWGHFAVVGVIGNAMLDTLSFDQKRGPWEVSFQLRLSEWGKGLMCEALGAARDWFLDGWTSSSR